MKENKTEKDLSILDSQDVEIDEKVSETTEEEVVSETVSENEVTEVAVSSDEDSEQVNEKKPIKPWILIASAALVLAIIAVGIFTWYQYTTLATYDGGRVTRAEFNKYFESTVLSQGITDDVLSDPENADAVQQFKDEILVSLAYDEVFYKQLENLNVGQLNEEEIAAVEEDCQTMLDDYITQNESTIIADLPEDYSDEELAAEKEEFGMTALNQIGCLNFQDFVDLKVKEEIFYKAYEELLPEESIAPTDDEVKAKYDSMLEEQQTAYSENPASYLNESSSLEYSLYVPSGIRTVRHILIKIEDETLDEISTLRSEGSDDEADTLYQETLAAIKPEAEAVLEKLNSDEITFTDAITEYNDDPGMEYYPDGYKICEGYDGFVEEFADASMNLKVIGEYTGLVATDYGYHIIEYYSDVPSEITPYEDVETDLYQTLLEANKSTRWLELIEQWPIDLNLQFKDESLSEIDIF